MLSRPRPWCKSVDGHSSFTILQMLQLRAQESRTSWLVAGLRASPLARRENLDPATSSDGAQPTRSRRLSSAKPIEFKDTGSLQYTDGICPTAPNNHGCMPSTGQAKTHASKRRRRCTKGHRCCSRRQKEVAARDTHCHHRVPVGNHTSPHTPERCSCMQAWTTPSRSCIGLRGSCKRTRRSARNSQRRQ